MFGYEHRHWSLERGAIPRAWILLGSIVLQSVMSICEINEEFVFSPKMNCFQTIQRSERMTTKQNLPSPTARKGDRQTDRYTYTHLLHTK